jgi:secreted PhoX family phosphatase
MSKELNRREFVKFFGVGSMALTALTIPGCALFSDKEKTTLWSPNQLPFAPLAPTDKDDLVLAPGFEYQVLISWGDKINNKGDTFGFNNDYTAFLPQGPNEGLLWVNHEYNHPFFLYGYDGKRKKTRKEVDLERYNLGGSILKLKRSNGQWGIDLNSPLNRRVTAASKIPIIAERAIAGSKMAEGTMANCAGGVTPWGTILTCEENYQNYYGERVGIGENGPIKTSSKYADNWQDYYQNPPEHYGWVVEVDPMSGKSKKLTSIGRFSHECCTTIVAPDGRVVAYSGDDKSDECLYKFISKRPNDLTEGELFVANIEKGQWISLDIKKQKVLQKHFNDQTEVLTYTRHAAKLVGGSKLDRPEDIQIQPGTNNVFACLTNNFKHDRYFGQIMKIEEDGNNPLSLRFKTSTYYPGGEDFAAPDNLKFDAMGNIWMTTDMSGSKMNKFEPYKKFKNNGLFYIPTAGPLAGKAVQIASAPADAEFTGISFDQQGKSIFLSVQHPGESSRSKDQLTSSWPKKGDPRPSVVTITGPMVEKLLQGRA